MERTRPIYSVSAGRAAVVSVSAWFPANSHEEWEATCFMSPEGCRRSFACSSLQSRSCGIDMTGLHLPSGLTLCLSLQWPALTTAFTIALILHILTSGTTPSPWQDWRILCLSLRLMLKVLPGVSSLLFLQRALRAPRSSPLFSSQSVFCSIYFPRMDSPYSLPHPSLCAQNLPQTVPSLAAKFAALQFHSTCTRRLITL